MINKGGQTTTVVLIFSAITVISWVGFEVARSSYQSTIPQVVEDQMRSLNPKINMELLEKLTTRISLTSEEMAKPLNQVEKPPTAASKSAAAAVWNQ